MGDKVFVRHNDEDISLKPPFIDLKELQDVRQVEVPSTAQEYLLSVISERQNLEEVTLCNVDYKKFRTNQSLFYDQEPLPTVADKFKPTKEWQNIQIADFSEIRSYISCMRHQKNNMKKLKKFNIKKNADIFWWRHIFTTSEPSLSLILGFTAAQLDDGIENLTNLIKLTNPGDGIDQYIGRWVYASLSCLKQPLHSDTVSIIRDLAKECWSVRSHINPDNENAEALAAPLTLIICIVGQYYRQLDLADNVE